MTLDDPTAELLSHTRAPIEYRSVEQLDVRFPDRIIELVAVPYEQPTTILRRGELISEVVARGAFAGVDTRANRVKVNRDHDLAKTVGRAAALHPSRDIGLVAELRIARTLLGDETLELADCGALDASVGFAPMPGGEEWAEHRSRRRITSAWLGHIALVPDPAYEGAGVLDVRAVAAVAHDVLMRPDEIAPSLIESPTPRLDEALALLRQIGYVPRK
jgi:HK97 family phage prohead protease